MASIWIFPGRNLGNLVATNQAGTAAETACQEATQELIEYAEFSRAGRASLR
jgi:hypothetical protein